MNRIESAIANARAAVQVLEADKAKGLDEAMAVDFEEHFRFQQEQAEAHAAGTLTVDEAMIVYGALGEVGSSANGGWAAGTDLATKVVVTKLMGELLARKVKGRA